MIGGGPESGIYKSINGGTTWTKLTKGLPKGDMGRIAMGVDPKAKPTRVYALINALADTGFYRSDDAGATWVRQGAPLDAPLPAAAPPPAPAPAARRCGGAARLARAPGAAAVAAAGAAAACRGVYRGGDPGYYYELYVDPDSAGHDLVREHATSSGAATAARRSRPCRICNGVHVDYHEVWSDTKDKNHIVDRQRRRPVRVVGRGHDVAALHESAGHAVLPREHRQRAAVLQRVRRRAGQRIDVRAEPDAGTASAFGRATGTPSAAAMDSRSRNDPDDANYRLLDVAAGRDQRLDLRTGQSQGIRPRAGGPGAGAGGAAGGGGGGAAVAAVARGGGGRGAGGGGGIAAERVNWDVTYIVEPAFGDAALLGQQPHVSHRRSRRHLDADQRRPDARARSARDSDHGQGVGSGDDRGLQQRDDDAQHDRLARRITGARRTDLRRHRRRQPADHRGRRQDVAQDDDVRQRAGRAVRVGRVRVAARRERRVRVAEQLAARRLQAVSVPQRRSRPHVQVDRRRSAGSASGLVGDSGSRERQSDLRRHRVRSVLHGGRRHRTGCSSRAACRWRRCATWSCRSARTIWCSARSAAASTCSTTTARCAR